MGKGGGPKKRRGTPSGEKGSTHRNVRGAGLWGAHHKPARGPPANPANPGCPSKVVDTPTANQPSQPASPPVQKQGGQRQTKTKTARKPPWTQLCGGRRHPAHRETDLLPATKTRGGETAGGNPQKPPNTRGAGTPNTKGAGLGPHRGCAGAQPTEGTYVPTRGQKPSNHEKTRGKHGPTGGKPTRVRSHAMMRESNTRRRQSNNANDV